MTLFFIQHLGITRLREVAKILKIPGYTLYDDPDKLRQHIMKYLTKRYYVRQKHLDKIGKSQEQIDRLTRHLRELAKEYRKRDSSPIRKAMLTTLTQLQDCGGTCPSDVKVVLSPQKETGMSGLISSLSQAPQKSLQKSPEIASASRKVYSLHGEERPTQPLSEAPFAKLSSPQEVLPSLSAPEKKEMEAQLYQEKVEAIENLEKCEKKEVELKAVLEKLDQQLGTSSSLANLSPLLDKVMSLQTEISQGVGKIKSQETIINEMKSLLSEKPQSGEPTVFEQKSRELISRVEQLDSQVRNLSQEILNKMQELANKDKFIVELNEKHQNLVAQEQEVRNQLAAKTQEILACNTSKEQCELKVQQLEEKYKTLLQQAQEQNDQFANSASTLQQSVEKMQQDMDALQRLHNQEILSYQEKIANLETKIAQLSAANIQGNPQIEERILALTQEKERVEQKYQEEFKQRNAKISQLEQDLNDKESKIVQLERENVANKKTITDQKEAHQKAKQNAETREIEMLQYLHGAISKNMRLEGLGDNNEIKSDLDSLKDIKRWDNFKAAMTALGEKTKNLRQQLRQAETKGETPAGIQQIRNDLVEANAKIKELEEKLLQAPRVEVPRVEVPRVEAPRVEAPRGPIIGEPPVLIPPGPDISFLDKPEEKRGLWQGLGRLNPFNWGGNRAEQIDSAPFPVGASAKPLAQPLPSTLNRPVQRPKGGMAGMF